MSTLRQLTNTCLLIAILPLVTFASSDTTTYRVDSYIPVLFKDARWTIGGSFGANGSDNHGSQAPVEYRPASSDASSDRQQLSFNTNWQMQRITRPSSWMLSALVRGNFSGSQQDNSQIGPYSNYLRPEPDIRTSRSDSYGVFFDPAASYLLYLKRDVFLSFQGQTQLSYTNTPHDNDQTEITRVADSSSGSNAVFTTYNYQRDGNRFLYNSFTFLELGVGFGRVYLGNYAATSLYMISELRDHGLLQKPPDHEVMDSLTEIIYQYRLRHVIDSRLTRIEALGAVIRYLQASGVVSSEDRALALYLQDVWDYFPKDDRPFGIRASFGIGWTDNYSYDRQETLNHNTTTNITRPINSSGPADTTFTESAYQDTSEQKSWLNSPYFFANFEYDKPLNMRTQLSIRVRGYSYFNASAYDGYRLSYPSGEYSAALMTSLSYIVNSRTRLDASSSLNYSSELLAVWPYGNPQLLPTVNSRIDDFQYQIGGSLTYRVAIPTTVVASLKYSGEQSFDPSHTFYGRVIDHSYSLSLSINHYLY